jgi:single-strand DNA-binding protein
MASVNKVILIGNLGRDPETRYSPEGAAITNVSVATTSQWKDKTTGEKREETEWHRVAFFGRLAEIAGEYLKKGRTVYIEGSLRTNSWDDKETGQKKYKTEIIVNDLVLLGGGQREGGEGGGGGGYSGGRSGAGKSSGGYDQRTSEPDVSQAPAGGGGPEITDEDIPF